MNRTEIASVVGHRIREAREEERYSRPRLSEETGASPSAIGRWEKGENLVPIDQLMVLSSVLDRPLSYFLCDLSPELQMASDLTGAGDWMPVVETDRSEKAVRLRDLAERAFDCEIFVAISPGKRPPQ